MVMTMELHYNLHVSWITHRSETYSESEEYDPLEIFVTHLLFISIESFRRVDLQPQAEYEGGYFTYRIR